MAKRLVFWRVQFDVRREGRAAGVFAEERRPFDHLANHVLVFGLRE
jgi:hypothetical protein